MIREKLMLLLCANLGNFFNITQEHHSNYKLEFLDLTKEYFSQLKAFVHQPYSHSILYQKDLALQAFIKAIDLKT